MNLRTFVRSVRRQWPIAAGAAATAFLLGLLVVPGAPRTVRAEARVVLSPEGGWTPSEAADRILADPVLRRALGGNAEPAELAKMRSMLEARAENDRRAVVIRRTAGRSSTAVASVNAVAHAFESTAPGMRREGLEASLSRVDASIKAQTSELAALGPPYSSQRLEQLQAEIAEQEREIASLSFRMDQIAGRLERGEPGPMGAVDTTDSERLSSELAAARGKLESLRAAYPDDFPNVVAAAEEVQALNLRLAQTRNREILQARFAPVRKAVDHLRELHATRDALSLQISQKRAEEEAARRLQPMAASPETESRRRTLAASIRELEAQRAKLLAEQALAVPPVARIEPASGARTLASPLLAIFAAALVLGVLAARAAEALVGTIRTEDDVRRYVNLPILGLLPRTPPGETLLLRAGPRAATVEPALAFGTLLSRQLAESKHKILAVTSARPGEGKSTIVANAAVALARGGLRVLVVDADLRRPTQHRLFSIAAAPGLTDYLDGSIDAADEAVAQTEVDAVHLLPAGAGLEGPLPYLKSERFRALLSGLKERYDVVLIDLPPARRTADALVAAPAADGTLLVLSAGETGKDDATAVKRLLRDAGATLVGCVLTKTALSSRGYEYYGPAVAT